MNVIFRILGGWLLIVAIVVLVNDVTRGFQGGGALRVSSLGKTWYALSPGTLNQLQAGIERHVHTALWDPLMLTVLKLPAFAVFLALGAAIYALGLRRAGTNIYAN